MKSIVCSQLVTVKYHTFSLTYFHYPAKNKHKYCNMLHILYATLLIFHIFKNYPYFHNHTKNAQRIFKGQPAVNICSGTLNTKNFTYIHKLQLRNTPVVNCEKKKLQYFFQSTNILLQRPIGKYKFKRPKIATRTNEKNHAYNICVCLKRLWHRMHNSMQYDPGYHIQTNKLATRSY